jgi:hypothetical protein
MRRWEYEMRLYVSADFHGGELDFPLQVGPQRFNTKNFPEGKEPEKNILIVAGDYGCLMHEDPRNKRKDEYWGKWLETKFSTIYVVPGNHENHKLWAEMIAQAPKDERCPGLKKGKAVKFLDHTWLLSKCALLDLFGQKIVCLGGAMSTDLIGRKRDHSWWPDEVPNADDLLGAMSIVATLKFTPDYVISHTGPQRVVQSIISSRDVDPVRWHMDMVALAWQELADKMRLETSSLMDSQYPFKKWYFGHYHQDVQTEDQKFRCLYAWVEKILENDE